MSDSRRRNNSEQSKQSAGRCSNEQLEWMLNYIDGAEQKSEDADQAMRELISMEEKEKSAAQKAPKKGGTKSKG